MFFISEFGNAQLQAIITLHLSRVATLPGVKIIYGKKSKPDRRRASVITTCIFLRLALKKLGLQCDWDAYNSMAHCLLHPVPSAEAPGRRRK